jgi:hypothetical protein
MAVHYNPKPETSCGTGCENRMRKAVDVSEMRIDPATAGVWRGH